MNKEIEVRFLEVDKNELVDKLIRLGAEDKGEDTLTEIIFYDTKLSWLKEKRFVRLRTIRDKTTLTYKENRGQTVDSAHEIEFPVGDQKKMIELLEKVGLVAYRYQEKKRHSFSLSDTAIDIDTWPQIPSYVELEGKSENDLRQVSASLGFNWDSAVFDDAKSLIEKRYDIPIGRMKWFTFNRFE